MEATAGWAAGGGAAGDKVVAVVQGEAALMAEWETVANVVMAVRVMVEVEVKVAEVQGKRRVRDLAGLAKGAARKKRAMDQERDLAMEVGGLMAVAEWDSHEELERALVCGGGVR